MTARLPQERKNFIRERDKDICRYCGRTWEIMTVDHVIPRSKGGTNDPENLVAACQPCNSLKADRTPEEAGMELSWKEVPRA